MKRTAGCFAAIAFAMLGCGGNGDPLGATSSPVDAPSASASVRFGDPGPPPTRPTESNANRAPCGEDPLDGCHRRGDPVNLSGRYAGLTKGEIHACVNDSPIASEASAILQVIIEQHDGDLAKGIVVVKGTGLVALDGTQLPATFTRSSFAVDTEIQGALPGGCSVPLAISIHYDFASKQPGEIVVEEKKACGHSCTSSIVMTLLLVSRPADAAAVAGGPPEDDGPPLLPNGDLSE